VTLLPPAGAVSSGSLTSLTLTAILRGDFNRDGHVNAADVPPMLTALADLNTFQSARGLSATDLLTIGDIDHDGRVTNGDVQSLLNLLKSGGGSITAVPEPASIVLLALALPGLAFAVVRRSSKRVAVWLVVVLMSTVRLQLGCVIYSVRRASRRFPVGANPTRPIGRSAGSNQSGARR